MAKSKRISIRLEPETARAFREVSKSLGLTQNESLRVLLYTYKQVRAHPRLCFQLLFQK